MGCRVAEPPRWIMALLLWAIRFDSRSRVVAPTTLPSGGDRVADIEAAHLFAFQTLHLRAG